MLYATFHLHSVRNGTQTHVLALYGTPPGAGSRDPPPRTAHPAGPPKPRPPKPRPTLQGPPSPGTPHLKSHSRGRCPPGSHAPQLPLPRPPETLPHLVPRDRGDPACPSVRPSAGRIPELPHSFLHRFERLCRKQGLGPQNIVSLSTRGRRPPWLGAGGWGPRGPSESRSLPRPVRQVPTVEESGWQRWVRVGHGGRGVGRRAAAGGWWEGEGGGGEGNT